MLLDYGFQLPTAQQRDRLPTASETCIFCGKSSDWPVERQFFQHVEVAGDVLEGCVRDPRTPGQVEASQLLQVFSDELDTVVCHLAATAEAEHCQVGKWVNCNKSEVNVSQVRLRRKEFRPRRCYKFCKSKTKFSGSNPINPSFPHNGDTWFNFTNKYNKRVYMYFYEVLLFLTAA